jgi:hypothetical protein
MGTNCPLGGALMVWMHVGTCTACARQQEGVRRWSPSARHTQWGGTLRGCHVLLYVHVHVLLSTTHTLIWKVLHTQCAVQQPAQRLG